MALFGLFKKKGRDATDTIDLTRMQSVRDKIKASEAAAASTSASTGTAAVMDLPMGTFDSTQSTPSTTEPSYSQPSNEERMNSKITALMQRVDLLEHKIDRLERKTGIKPETEIV
jgi:hypothetical protein